MKVNPGIDFIKRFWRVFLSNISEKLSPKKYNFINKELSWIGEKFLTKKPRSKLKRKICQFKLRNKTLPDLSKFDKMGE